MLLASQNEIEELEKYRAKCLNCTKCSLANSRTNIVFSGGVPNHKMMLIGEAPGFYEDQKGEPFVGKAGQLLDKILASVGFSRKELCRILKKRASLHMQYTKMQTARKQRSAA